VTSPLHHSLQMWGGGVSRGILRCLVLIHEPMVERNCPFCVLAGCPQWVYAFGIFLYMFVVGAFVPALLLHIAILIGWGITKSKLTTNRRWTNPEFLQHRVYYGKR
jgi:hypothetical protein